MRVCYFIQSHRGGAQLPRLVRTLRAASPGCRILVGHDARSGALSRADLPPGADLFHPPGPIERGRLSLLSPYFLAVEWLAERGIDYDWLVYLSGQDYPTQPLARSEAFLAASAYDGFLTWWEAFGLANGWGRPHQGRRRYGYQYADAPRWLSLWLRPLHVFNGVQSFLHLHLTYGPRIGVRARHSPFQHGFVCYGGSQWLTLRRSCAEYLAENVRREAALLAYYRRCVCPDESVCQTILVNGGRFRLCNDNLRFMDFRGSRTGSPRVLTLADFEALADDRYHFARKFDLDVDARILDRLDARIFGAA